MQWLLLLILIPYIYIIFRISVALKGIKTFLPETEPGIFVSVIVACRNEEINIPLLMVDIANQNYPPDLYELTVIDDNSSDSTLKVASGFIGIKNLKVLKNIGRGKKEALRTGIEASVGKLIITTDADCRVGKRWIRTIASFQVENKSEMIICPVRLEAGKGFFSGFQELEFLSLQGITAGTAVSGNPVMCNGANLAFLKEIYSAYAGNLHNELVSGDDVFLLHSLKGDNRNKIDWIESEESMVITGASPTIGSFLRQRARWISKTGYYTDKYTLILAIVTFVTICLQAFLTAAAFFSQELLMVFMASLLLKSLPDFMVLHTSTARYKRKNLMKWFLPSQVVYPFYVLAIAFTALRGGAKYSG
jgi:cellulose synthase/poly-beta-1,6-N-acetylglucosamine synthase-like glycosyltransferase